MSSLLFWGLCIPLRCHLAMIGDWLPLRVLAAVVGARWVLGLIRSTTGFFGGPAWWAEERRAHGVLWLLYAGTGRAVWLKLDVAFGMLNWLSSKG